MSNTTHAELRPITRRALVGVAAMAGITAACSQPASAAPQTSKEPSMPTTTSSSSSLPAHQLAIGPIAASAAVGEMAALKVALNEGLDAGLSISDVKEILVQLYAYAGFPRSLNALSELMKLVEQRRQRGIVDSEGRDAGPVPVGAALLATGTANQTKLSGAPVEGPLFDFAPAIDQYLKTHLFGDIFARDNVDWQSRELATVAILSALSGVESQLQSHVRISINIGLTPARLKQFAEALVSHGHAEAGARARAAIEKHTS